MEKAGATGENDATEGLFAKRKRPGNVRPTNVSNIIEEIPVVSEGGQQATKVHRRSAASSATNINQDGKSVLRLEILYASSGRAGTRAHDDVATAEATYDPTVDKSKSTPSKNTTHRMEAEADGLQTTYRGKSNYQRFIHQGDTLRANAGSHKSRIAGPVKASANIRTTARFDYAPCLCKDYLETGFCGFGDSCVFVHDRGEYKAGWELDAEWEREQGKWSEEGVDKYLVKDEVEVEKECKICKDADFRERPVQTECGHKFCEPCILGSFKRSRKCPTCRADISSGILRPVKGRCSEGVDKQVATESEVQVAKP